MEIASRREPARRFSGWAMAPASSSHWMLLHPERYLKCRKRGAQFAPQTQRRLAQRIGGQQGKRLLRRLDSPGGIARSKIGLRQRGENCGVVGVRLLGRSLRKSQGRRWIAQRG